MYPSSIALRHHRLPMFQEAQVQQPQLAILLDSHGAEVARTAMALRFFQRDLMEVHRLTSCYKDPFRLLTRPSRRDVGFTVYGAGIFNRPSKR